MKQNSLQRFKLWLQLGLTAFALMMTSAMFAQVTGTVTDVSTGETLIGATVVIKGTLTGSSTNIDGKYKIDAKAGDVLQVSYTGYETQEVTVGASNTIDVALSEGVTIDQVVVTGYTSQSTRNITGAVSTVDVKEITDLPVNSVQQALQGRVAGVNVTSSGAPGSGTNIRIRGYGTINNNDPLYIIDGVPVKGGLNEINPNDIKSIQVLKDASAASIYGARAGNGVVIITTKNGSVTGKSKVTIDASYGTQSPNNLPDLMNPQQLAEYIWQLQLNADPASTPSHGQYGTGATPVLPTYINGDPNQPYDAVTNAVTRAATGDGTDWLDEIFQAAPIYNLNLGASGGSEAGQYALSLGYLNQEGTVIHTGYERYTLRANTLFRPKKWLRVGENFTVSYGDRVDMPGGIRGTGNAISQAFRSPAIIPVYDEEGNFAGSKGGELTNAANPVAQLFRNKDNNSTNLRAFGNAYIEADIIEGLTAKTTFNIDYNNWRFKGFTFPNPEDIEGDANRNILNQSTGNTFNWTWYNTLNYSTTVAEDHNIDVLLGTEAIDQTYEQVGVSNSGFASFDPSYWYLHVATGTPLISNTFGVSSSLFSVFGKLDYNYQGKYLASVTVRRDGSSRFGADNRFATFPAFNLGWRVSDESFMADQAIVKDLKVRVGWGKTGNQDIGDYRFVPQYGFSAGGSTYDIGGSGNVASGFAQSVNANADIKWEETTSLNIGFDAELDGGFFINFDWYDRLTEDMLVAVPAPSTGAIASDPIRNIGDVSNTGIDLVVGYSKKLTSDLTLDVSLNFGTYTNEVVSLGGPDINFNSGSVREFNASRIQEGFPIAYFYGLEVSGLDNEGRFTYTDVNNDGEITLDDDRKFIGSPHPDFTYGINIGLSYKDFDLAIFATGVQGNELFNANKYFTHFNSFQGNRSTDLLNSFGYPGATGTATLPQVNQNAPAQEFNSTSFFVEDGSFFRIKNVQLGYNVPVDALGEGGLESLKVFVQATNLLTITNYTGLDPEIGRSTFFGSGPGSGDWGIGIDSGFYPVTRVLTVGIKGAF